MTVIEAEKLVARLNQTGWQNICYRRIGQSRSGWAVVALCHIAGYSKCFETPSSYTE